MPNQSGTLRVCKVAEPPLQASKWLKSPALLDTEEMRSLLEYLGEFHIVMTSAICEVGDEEISKSNFLTCYGNYVDALKKGQWPDEKEYRSYFSSVFTRSLEPLYSVPVGENKQIVRVARPVIQLQIHKLGYSMADGKFHSMSFGSDSILWGVQFSYPQLYQDPVTHEISSIFTSPGFPNTQLFQAVQKWMRENTIPTPIMVEGKRTNLPVRLGKLCLGWINQHPQLFEKNISIAVS